MSTDRRTKIAEREGVVHGLDDATYHRRPELSSTGARQILDSPARFAYLRTHPQEHKEAFSLGSAVHSKVLGVGATVEILDFADWRTKAAQQARDDVRASGGVPMLQKDYQPVLDMAEAVLAHPTGRALLEQPGHAEASVFATDPATGVDVRARFDFLPDLDAPNPIAVDLKTSAKRADADTFARTALDFGYETQESFYGDAHEFATGARLPFVFLVVETEPPHFVAVHQLDVMYRSMGSDKAKRAREIYAACNASGEWPSYPTNVQLVAPPSWALYRHEEQFS